MAMEQQPAGGPILMELLAAAGAALLAGYVRSKTADGPWRELKRLPARVIDAVVCGLLAMALVNYAEWAEWVPNNDPATLAGVAAAISLFGTNTLSGLAVRWAEALLARIKG